MLSSYLLIALLAAPGTSSQEPTAPVVEARDDISYDVFMLYDIRIRKRIFNLVSAEAKARLMRTHVERSLAAYRAKLTAEQIKAIEEVRPLITPPVYSGAPDSPAKAALKEKSAQLHSLLGDWAEQFVTLDALYPGQYDVRYVPASEAR
jgi:hypothetical protein